MKIEKKEYGQALTEQEARFVAGAMRDLATQIMRFSRGSGDISRLMEALLKAGQIAESLSALPFASLEHYFAGLADWDAPAEADVEVKRERRAIDNVCSGALQIVASRLSGVTQGGAEGKGLSQVLEGIRMFSEIHTPTRGSEDHRGSADNF